jgi:uncharacterized membrane protein YraQ (UPF0718 family)
VEREPAAVRKPFSLLTGDQGFESIPLQRGVLCEPDLRGRERARRLVLAAFLSDDPVWSKVVGPVIGPAVAVISFVCSIGNVPLAAALWNGGISFGGVVAFRFADLIVLPIVDIYRKYYGPRVAALLFALFYVAIAGAGYIVELLFGALGLVPGNRRVQILQESVSWNYTTVLNIAALALSAVAITATPSIPAPAAAWCGSATTSPPCSGYRRPLSASCRASSRKLAGIVVTEEPAYE